MLNNEHDADQGPSIVPPATTQARGSFDIRARNTGNGPDKKKLYLAIAAVVLVGLGIVIGGWALVLSRMKASAAPVDESKVKPDVALIADKGRDDSMEQARKEQLKKWQAQEDAKQAQEEQERLAREREQNSKPGGKTTTNPVPNAPAAHQTESTGLSPAQRKLGSGLVITPVLQDVTSYGAAGSSGKSGGDSNTKPFTAADLAAAAGSSSGLGNGSGSNTRGSLSQLSGTSFVPTQAVLAPSRKYLLAHNTYTRCALYTEIVTDQPGLVDCRLTGPLYSADGSTVLADAGDRLTGEQNVEVKPGQVRVFTSWTELETQSGVRARLDSLGAGPMGASGTEAWIDNHYRERFGGAIMLSFIQDALQAVANTTQKSSSNSGYTVNNSEQNVENMAEKALENSINIAPTGHILPGTVMTVIVARDIDFSSVFENR